MGSNLVSFTTSSDFSKTTAYFNKLKQTKIGEILARYGPQGVAALRASTPVESGETAAAWYYTVDISDGRYQLTFHNDHIEEGVLIAILIQYGHGTRTGGYVVGRDFINPAVQPIFDQIYADTWKEVTSL